MRARDEADIVLSALSNTEHAYARKEGAQFLEISDIGGVDDAASPRR